MPSAPDPLDSLLNRWRGAQPPLPPQNTLGQEVWRRIADAEASAHDATGWARLEAAFSRPSFAAVFIAACTVFGLFLAELRVSRIQAQRNTQLAQAYVQLIDPLLDVTATASAAEAIKGAAR